MNDDHTVHSSLLSTSARLIQLLFPSGKYNSETKTEAVHSLKFKFFYQPKRKNP